MTCMRARRGSKFGVPCISVGKKSPYTYNGEKGVATFSRLFLIGSFSYLKVKITCTRACMSSKFGQIRPRTAELAALERLKNPHRLKMEKKMVLPPQTVCQSAYTVFTVCLSVTFCFLNILKNH